VFVGKGRLAEADLRTQRAEPLYRIVPLDPVDDGMDTIHHVTQIDRGKGQSGQTERPGSFSDRPDGRRSDEGLGRDTTEMEAIAAEPRGLLDENRFRTELRPPCCRSKTGGAAADDSQVVIKWRHDFSFFSFSDKSH
jgi:hypothetical protein